MESPSSQILEAKESFVCEIEDERFFVIAGVTRVAAEHRLAKAHPNSFRPLLDGTVMYGVEEATAEPGRRSRPPRPDTSQQQSEQEKQEKRPSPPNVSKGLTTESLRRPSFSKGE